MHPVSKLTNLRVNFLEHAMAIYDISVSISAARTPVYPGDPSIEITNATAIARGDVANVSHLNFGAHTATHVDAPAHFIEGGAQVATLSLDVLIGRARVIEIPVDAPAVNASHVAESSIGGATRVLFKTRNSNFWREDGNRFREDFAYITPEAARSLVAQNVQLVGLDYLSVEQMHSPDFATHKALLSQSIVIIEGLDLSAVPAGDYELICLPLKIADGTGDGAPARTILRTLSDERGTMK